MWFTTISGLWSTNTDPREACPINMMLVITKNLSKIRNMIFCVVVCVCVCVLQVLEEFMSYSGEMTHPDYSRLKMGDPYSIFMVDQTRECYLSNWNVSVFRTGFMDTVSFCRCAVSRFWRMPGWIRRRVNCSLHSVSLKAEPALATPLEQPSNHIVMPWQPPDTQ